MGNSRRNHAIKSKAKNKKKSSLHKEEEKTTLEDQQMEQMAGDQAGEVVIVDAGNHEEEEEKKKTLVVLRCKDGVELVVSKEEASRYGRTIERKITYGEYSHAYDPPRSSCNHGHSMVRLSVKSEILSIVIRYSNKKHDDSGWDATELVAGLDHATLFRLILAAKDLENRGLLGIACQAVAGMIDGNSERQIRAMFGIRPPPNPAGGVSTSTLQEVVKRITLDDDQTQFTMTTSELELEEMALRALHTVRCQNFTAYNPKRRAYWHARYCDYNIVFFDLDKESTFGRGPPLHGMPASSIASSSVDFISLKVCESDVGFPINVFGTVISRDMIDYRCVYLFRRDADDSQDDMLTLIDPHRGLVPEDIIYFEVNLKIKCDGGVIKDFSKGLTDFNICRLHHETMTAILTSWLSRVELEIAHVPCPLEASITINIKEQCELRRVAAWTSGNSEARIILYGAEAATETHMTKAGSSIALARRVVFVPQREKLVLHLVGHGGAEDLFLTLGHCDDEVQRVCKMGCSELQVKVSWTAIPKLEICLEGDGRR